MKADRRRQGAAGLSSDRALFQGEGPEAGLGRLSPAHLYCLFSDEHSLN